MVFGSTIFHSIALHCSDTSPILEMVIDSMSTRPRYVLEETINKLGFNDQHVLAFAAFFNKVHQTRLLLQAGAIPDVDETKRTTPLLGAIQQNSHEILKLLLHHGAKLHLVDTQNMGLLHVAGICGDLETIEILSDIKSDVGCLDVGAQDIFGRTPIQNFDERRSMFVINESEDTRAKAREVFMAFLERIQHLQSANFEVDRVSIWSDNEEFFDVGSIVYGDS